MYQMAIRNNQGLSNEQIAQKCPAVLATTAHVSRSQRYLYIPTIEVLEGLRREGFVLTEAMQSKSRIEGKQEFTKHLLRFRRADLVPTLNEEFPEIVLENSHDGTSGYKIMVGIFRLVCTNGLIKGDVHSTINVMHRGNHDTLSKVIDATYIIAEQADQTMEEVAVMKQIELNQAEQLLFARHAITARFGEPDPNLVVEGSIVPTPEQPHPLAVLHSRQRQDRQQNNLWVTFNTIQQNLIQGGVQRQDGKRTRAVNSIDKKIGLNTSFWAMAEELAQFKLQGNSIPETEQTLSF